MTENSSPETREEFSIGLTLEGDEKPTTYITNELSGFQDQAIAGLLRDINLGEILESFFGEVSANQGEGDTALKLSVPLVQVLLTKLVVALADQHLVTFLSIVLVPQDKPVYRKPAALKLAEVVGDLTNTQIKLVMQDFFSKNSLSDGSLLSFLKPSTETETETKVPNPQTMIE